MTKQAPSSAFIPYGLPDHPAGRDRDQDHLDYMDAPNYGERPTSSPKNQLVVFLPGNATLTNKYTNFYTEAATQGYHVIALDFLNGVSQHQLCWCNETCYGALAQQQFDGTPHGFYDRYFDPSQDPPPPWATKMQMNSINTRLSLFLHYLQNNDPNGNWLQFFNASGQPDWPNIIIAGHSDGGFYATWILKNAPAKKGLTFSSPSTWLDLVYTDFYPVTPTDESHANQNCTAKQRGPSIWWVQSDGSCNYPEGKLRSLLGNQDPHYLGTGIDLPLQPDGGNQHGNLSSTCMLTGPQRDEFAVFPALDNVSQCANVQANGTKWLTLFDPNAGHFSTIGNSSPFSATLLHCLWDYMLAN